MLNVGIDPLTGLCNRQKLYECGLIEFQRYFRYKRDISLIIASIDNFFHIQSKYSIEAIEQWLQQLSQEIAFTFRPTDIVSRYSDEKFVIMLPETGIQGAMIASDRLKQSIQAMNHWLPVSTSVSVGYADMSTVPDFGEFDDLLAQAEKALNKEQFVSSGSDNSSIN